MNLREILIALAVSANGFFWGYTFRDTRPPHVFVCSQRFEVKPGAQCRISCAEVLP